jgi:hypothetical protein
MKATEKRTQVYLTAAQHRAAMPHAVAAVRWPAWSGMRSTATSTT